jgi:hypothetical protein
MTAVVMLIVAVAMVLVGPIRADLRRARARQLASAWARNMEARILAELAQPLPPEQQFAREHLTIWSTSAPNLHDSGTEFLARHLRGDVDPDLTYIEWSADPE